MNDINNFIEGVKNKNYIKVGWPIRNVIRISFNFYII